jgi:hypothetical protein
VTNQAYVGFSSNGNARMAAMTLFAAECGVLQPQCYRRYNAAAPIKRMREYSGALDGRGSAWRTTTTELR